MGENVIEEIKTIIGPDGEEVSYLNMTHPDILADAMGLVAVYPAEDELLLDLDFKFSGGVGSMIVMRLDPLKKILKQLEFKSWKESFTESKSGNTHMYIKLDRPITPMERILLQAVLGSDPKREALSYVRLKQQERGVSDIPPTVLFEKEDQLHRIGLAEEKKDV